MDFDPTVKPERGTYELDLGHPLAPQLYASADEFAGVASLLLGGSRVGSNSVSNWGVSVAGICAIGQTGNFRIPQIEYNGPFTVEMIGSFTGSAGTYVGWNDVGSFYTNSTNCGGYALGVKIGYGPYFLHRNNNQNSDVDSSPSGITSFAATLTNGQFYHLVGTFIPGVGCMYLNGIQRVRNTGAGASVLYDTSGFRMCDAGAIIVIGRIYNRALSPGEVRWLYEEPYVSLRPVIRRVYSIPSGGTVATRLLSLRRKMMVAA